MEYITAESILLTILLFFVLVGSHELGHLYFAKRAGILVREYAIGFGPKIFSYKKGETRYTFRLLPLGGYVRMAGEDPEMIEVQKGQTVAVKAENGTVTRIYVDQLDTRKNALRGTVKEIDLERRLRLKLDVDGDLQTLQVHPQALIVGRGSETQIAPWDRQFGSKTVGQRMMAIFAGPMMNFAVAFILFLAFIYMTGVPVENPTHVELSYVSEGYPAEEAGLRKGDIVYSINGEVIGADRERMIEMIQQSPDKPMQWVIVRDGEKQEIAVTPRKNEEGIGIVGVGVSFPNRIPGIGEAVSEAGSTMWNAAKQIFVGLRMLVTLQFNLDDLGGPVRITETTGAAVSQGMNIYVFWTALLSLYLGIFNLLPFPSLDGSRLLFLSIEGIRGKPVDPQREGLVHFIGFAVLMLLMIVVTYNDILRLFEN